MAYVLLSLLASIRSRQKRSLPAAPGSGVVSLAGKRYSLIWSRSEVVVAWGRAAPHHNSLHRSRRARHLGLQATNQSRCPQCQTPQLRMDPVLGGDRMLVSTLIWKTSISWWTSGASPMPSSPQTDSSCHCRERMKERGRGDSQSQSVVPFAHSATRLLPPVATAATLLKNRERLRQEINKCDYGDWFPKLW